MIQSTPPQFGVQKMLSLSVDVLLAVNKMNPQYGNQDLEQLKHDFHETSKVLCQLECTIIWVQNDVFAAIVGMCNNRILYRLGHAATSRNVVQQSVKAIL